MRRVGLIALTVLSGALVACGGSPEPGGPGSASGETDNLPAGCEPGGDPLVLRGVSEPTSALAGLRALAVLDEVVYGCAERGGLVRWSVADPTAPRWLGGDPAGPTASCQALAIEPESRRLALARPDAIELYALEEAASPIMLARTEQAGVSDLRFADEKRLLAAAGRAGVLALRVTDAGLEEEGRAQDERSDARALALAEGRLWVAEGEAGLRGYALDEPLALVGAVGLAGVAVDVQAMAARAYVATLEGVAAVDTSDPARPEVLAQPPSPGAAVGLALTAQTLWLADWEAVRGLDLADPALPFVAHEALVGDGPLPRATALLAHEGQLLVAHDDGLRTYTACPADAPSLWPEASRVDFRDASVASRRDRVLAVRNLGNQPLVVDSLATDNPSFVVDPAGFTVAPGGAHSVEISFIPLGIASVEGHLLVASNDPDEPEREIPLTGNVPGVVVGEPMVPFFNVATDGRSWRPQDVEGQVVLLAYFATW